MNVKATGTLDYPTVCTLMRLSMFRKWEPKKAMQISAVVYVILSVIIILEMHFFCKDAIQIGALIVVILCYILLCYLYFLFPKIRFVALGTMKNIVNEFVFLDDIIFVSAQNENYSGECKMEYTGMKKVVETSKYFYIYYNASQVYPVEKATITNGTEEDIRNKFCDVQTLKYSIRDY